MSFDDLALACDLKLGRGRTCGRCGTPCKGSAQIGDTPYCHPSTAGYPDCYSLQCWENAPRLPIDVMLLGHRFDEWPA